MTVKQLIEQLKKCDPEAELIIQEDAEGNYYSPLYCIDKGYYIPENTWNGKFISKDYIGKKDYEEETGEYYCNQDKAKNSVVLAPVN